MRIFARLLSLALLLPLGMPPGRADVVPGDYVPPANLLSRLDDYPHSQRVDASEREVVDHEIGLGPIEKLHGSWQFKESERRSGTLSRYTWQIVDGFTSREVMDTLLRALEERGGARLLFACDGRACGNGSQWANRVFGQRVLYGRDDQQFYRVFELANGAGFRLVIYASARTTDRQYLHVDLLRLAD